MFARKNNRDLYFCTCNVWIQNDDTVQHDIWSQAKSKLGWLLAFTNGK